jgi:hypothetical protein
MSREPDSLIATARDAGARYIVLDHLDGLSQLYLGPAIIARPAAFCLVYQSPLDGTAVLGVRDDAETVAGATGASASIPPCGPGWIVSDEIARQAPVDSTGAGVADSIAADSSTSQDSTAR